MIEWFGLFAIIAGAGLLGRWHYLDSRRIARRWVGWLTQDKD